MTDREVADKITFCMKYTCEDCEYSGKHSLCEEFREIAFEWLARRSELCTTWAADNQSIKADAGKPELTLIPLGALIPIARVREYGVKKYGAKESWREVSIERYQNAAFRHWLKYLQDPHGVDEESGLPHLWHCLCNMCFLTELELNDMEKKE